MSSCPHVTLLYKYQLVVEAEQIVAILARKECRTGHLSMRSRMLPTAAPSCVTMTQRPRLRRWTARAGVGPRGCHHPLGGFLHAQTLERRLPLAVALASAPTDGNRVCVSRQLNGPYPPAELPRHAEGCRRPADCVGTGQGIDATQQRPEDCS